MIKYGYNNFSGGFVLAEKRSYIRVNNFAPKDGKLHVFFKKVGEKKSDGFALLINDEVYVIDGGKYLDDGMFEFLGDLREKWLSLQNDACLLGNENAKLEIRIIISHPHSDHAYTLPKILSDPRFHVLTLYAPQRSYLSLDVEGALPSLTRFENKITELVGLLCEHGHTAQSATYLPFGKTFSLKTANENIALTLFTAPYDWSTKRESPKEGIEFLKQYQSKTYSDNPELGISNGVANGNSLWVKVSIGDQSLLITGDQRDRKEMMDAMINFHGKENFRCDVLKYPHHGELNYSPYMMEVASPKITVITTTEPLINPELTALCKEYGQMFCLCDGNLFITFDGENITPSGILPR